MTLVDATGVVRARVEAPSRANRCAQMEKFNDEEFTALHQPIHRALGIQYPRYLLVLSSIGRRTFFMLKARTPCWDPANKLDINKREC